MKVRRIVALALAALVVLGLAPATNGAAAAPAPPANWPGVECPAPLPGPQAVVQLAYIVLLRRCPDAVGSATWEASLREGMAVETFARRIASTPEARAVVVGDAYALVLGRPASPAERAFWAGWLRPDPTRTRRHDQLLAELAASAELYAAAGKRDPRFVELVYERILGRPAPAADRDYWVGRLTDLRGDRRALARLLLRLTEPLGATVDAAWLEVLGTTTNAPDRAQSIARLRADGDRLGLSAHLVASDGFQAKAQDRAIVVPGRYVALGDSFVIGEGNEPWVERPNEAPEPGEPEVWRCGYAVSAYPEVARTTSERVPSDLDVAACTGSTFLDLYPYVESGGPSEEDPGEVEEPFTIAGQIDALTDGPAPTLVTLTIGGNDIGYSSIVQSCLQIRIQGQGQHSPYYSAEECDAWLDDLAPAALEELRTGQDDVTQPDGDGYQCPEPCSLTGAVDDVMAAAPEADVLVVGYPPLMPPVDTGCKGPVRIGGKVAAGVEWYVAPADVRRGRELIADLNGALREAAEAAGATYVDPGSRFAGHEVCSADPWIHGVNLDEDAFPLFSTFHPTPRGGTAVAAAVTDALED